MKKLLIGWVAGAALLAGRAMAADLAAVPVGTDVTVQVSEGLAISVQKSST